MARYSDAPTGGFPRPGRALRGVLIGLLAVWLAFAVGINWAGAPDSLFLALCGNTAAILHGQVWRLFTAPFMHEVHQNVGHVLWALIVLYVLGAPLESHFGSGRFLRFLAGSAILSYLMQMLVELVLPAELSARLVPDYWFGSGPVLSAVSIAWALSARSRNLMFIGPVTSRALVVFVLLMNLMYLIARAAGPEGQIAPFCGMLAGWLLGSGPAPGGPSPIRRAWLKVRLAQLDAEAKREAGARKKRVSRAGFQVIEGGKDDPSDEGPKNGGSGGGRGPNGGYLN